jgi:hypothetical protein
MSKGRKPRPIPDRKKFEDNWDRIFGKPKKGNDKSGTSTKAAPAV